MDSCQCVQLWALPELEKLSLAKRYAIMIRENKLFLRNAKVACYNFEKRLYGF